MTNSSQAVYCQEGDLALEKSILSKTCLLQRFSFDTRGRVLKEKPVIMGFTERLIVLIRNSSL